MKTKIGIALVVCCLALVGCVYSAGSVGANNGINPMFFAQEVTLSDGTPCLLVRRRGGDGIAVSCGWQVK